MKSIVSFLFASLLCATMFGQESKPLHDWIYPDALTKQQRSSPVTVTSADKASVQSVTNGLGQYVTEDPFHVVVKYYVEKSGLKPPNWSILGRKFPETNTHIPAHFNRQNIYREKPSVTILHYIRKNVASCQFLVTDHPDVGFMSISITRGKEDETTLIQIIQHPFQKIKRGG